MNQIEEIKNVFQFIVSSQLQQDIFFLKLIFIFVALLFFAGVVYFLFRTDWFYMYYLKDLENIATFKDFGAKKWQRRWNKIKKQLEKETETHYKLGLIEAEKFLDDILERMGLQKLTQDNISNLTEVLQARQVCQDITRDPDYRLSKERAEKVLAIFERALTELQVL